MTDQKNVISVPDMCRTHQQLLVSQTGYTEKDNWKGLIIAAQLALFHYISLNKNSMEKLEHNLKNIGRFKCMACERPDGFGEIVEAGKSHNLKDINTLIQKWILLSQEAQEMNIDEWAKRIYDQNVHVGWWDNPDRCLYETLQLVSTEVAEATEGERKNLMDDHLKHRKMAEVELADAMIRILDIGGHLALVFNPEVEPHRWCIDENASIGKQHLGLNAAVVDMGFMLEGVFEQFDDTDTLNYHYSQCINSLFHVANRNGYDLVNALKEKHEYNRNRADHKRENREKEGGKKF